jgi:hypothetical protein
VYNGHLVEVDVTGKSAAQEPAPQADDAELAFAIQQVFAGLGLPPSGEAVPPPPLTPEIIARDVRNAFAELDLRQLAIMRRFSPARRLAMAFDLCESARQLAIAGIRCQYPGIGDEELYEQLRFRIRLAYGA